MYTMFVAIQDDLDQSGMIDVVVHWEDAPSVVLTLDKRFTNDQAIELLHTSRFTVVGKVTPILPNDDEALNLYRRSVMALLPALTKMSMWGMLTLLASVARAVEGSDWWALSYHLLPFFKDHALDEITVAEVDRYKVAKLAEARLGAAQINKTLRIFSMVMDQAIEYELIDRANPAQGRRRRVKVPKPKRTWVEPEQLIALIEAASPTCRPIVATLAGAGLRVGEVLALDWRDISLATGTLTVGEAKTAAGTYREVHLPGGLIEALSEWRARNPTGNYKPVFTTRTGSRQTVTNVDHRLKTRSRQRQEAGARRHRADQRPRLASQPPAHLRVPSLRLRRRCRLRSRAGRLGRSCLPDSRLCSGREPP